MGRKKKYLTEEERIQAQREWNRKSYAKNKEKLNMKRMEEYYEERIKKMEEELSKLREGNALSNKEST